jgi:orotate phosphoribosyltransferase
MEQSENGVARLRKLINSKCIARVPKGSRELPSIDGKGFYGWQFYLRSALLDPQSLMTICDNFWEKFETVFVREPFQLAGVEQAALPLITAIILDGYKRGHRLSGFGIRKLRKTYGLRNFIEGAPNNLPVFLIDDLTSPEHNSLWHAIHVLGAHGLALNGSAYVVVRKASATAPRLIQTSLGALKLESLFTLDDFDLSFEDYAKSKLRFSEARG